jgi:hypothetical protein
VWRCTVGYSIWYYLVEVPEWVVLDGVFSVSDVFHRPGKMHCLCPLYAVCKGPMCQHALYRGPPTAATGKGWGKDMASGFVRHCKGCECILSTAAQRIYAAIPCTLPRRLIARVVSPGATLAVYRWTRGQQYYHAHISKVTFFSLFFFSFFVGLVRVLTPMRK